MSQLEDQLVDVLVEKCADDEATTFVDALLADAMTAIAGGKGQVAPLTSSGLNGKNFTRMVALNAIQVASACRRALRIYNEEENEVAVSRADFRCIQH